VKIGSTAAKGGADRRYVRLRRNADTIAMRQCARSLDGTCYVTLTDLVELESGDELSVSVFQNTDVTMSYYGTVFGLMMAPYS